MTLPILTGLIALGLTFAFTFSCDMFTSTSLDTLNQSRGWGLWTVQGDAPLLVNGNLYQSSLTGNPKVSVTAADITAITQDAQGWLSGKGILSSSEMCYPYTQFGWSAVTNLFDTEMQVARAFGMAASIFALILGFILLLMGCVRFRSNRVFYVMGFLCILEAIFSGVALIALRSTYCVDATTCSIGYSAICCIIATSLWALLGLILLCMPKNSRDSPRPTVAPEQQEMKHAEAPVVVVATTATRDVEGGQRTAVAY